MLFYVFVFILIICRIAQYSIAFTTYLVNDAITTALIAADGCNVAIGLSQVALVCDIVITLEMFKE